ncbi:MAG: SUMF1/EgtB/PvdO family nonheme iron enzyme, partial [Phycisphaerae bacterium]|nr:SUMF1/EgtB/PvdO family nonheme iron enzyme [Phycisphaerae bacterium]
PGGGGVGARAWSARFAAAAVVVLGAGAGVARAQSQITPGAPSIPLTATAQASGAQITYQYGIEFVTIPGGTLNAQPWQGNGTEGDRAVGRGAVPYDYRIGRFEVTTAQWVAFFNAAYDRPQSQWLPHLLPPTFWGAAPTTPTTAGGRRWTVPAGNEMRPVGNISWRMAAMYCNWLHNGQSSDRSAFLSGAYDVSTFGYVGQSGIFTDQFTHSPGARFWIPTLDEMLMAGHYDPNRHGAGQGGWWLWDITSDTPPVYGPPGVMVNGRPAQANANWGSTDYPGFNPFTISLGAYPTVQSPWGLLDLAGGTFEWLEEVLLVNELFPAYRAFDGSAWGGSFSAGLDIISYQGGDFPSLSLGDLGFRIAAAIPSPSTAATMALALTGGLRRRRFACAPRAVAPVHLRVRTP